MKKTCLLGWFAAALMLAACQDTVNTVENADKTMTPNTIADARFVTDGFLKDRLGLQSVTMGRTADGFKRVQLEVINLRTGVLSQAWSGITGENPYKIRYRFTWFDEDGMAVNKHRMIRIHCCLQTLISVRPGVNHHFHFSSFGNRQLRFQTTDGHFCGHDPVCAGV